MPTYDYECDACGHKFEMFQSITAAPVRKCPDCGKSKARRLIGCGAGIIFKGSGFYQTDYRSDSYKQAAQKDGAGSSSTSTASTASSGTSTKAASDSSAKSSGKGGSKKNAKANT